MSYFHYYSSQSGGGALSGVGELYHTPVIYQRGTGIGSFFSGLLKHLKPLFFSGLNAIKEESLKSGSEILRSIGSKPIKEILKEQGKILGENLTTRSVEKIKKMQKGGKKRKAVTNKKNVKAKRAKTIKRKNTKKIQQYHQKRNTKRQNKKKPRVLDIFST